MRAALQRLDNNPRLAGGDPKGDFTYEDPVLVTLVLAMRKKNAFGTAGQPGSDLKKLNIKWLAVPLKVLFDNSGKAWEMLERRGHTQPVRRQETAFRAVVFGDAGYHGKAVHLLWQR